MVLNTREILNVLQILSEERNIRVTVKESLKGGLLAGSCAAAGGVIGGPVGLAVGGTIGAVLAGVLGKDKYKSVAYIILNDMTVAQQNALANSVRKALEDVSPADVATILPLVLATPNLQEVVLRSLISFIQSEMNMQIII